MGIVASPWFMGDPMPGFRVPQPHFVLEPELPPGTPQQRMATLYAELADVVATDPGFPIVYAGDCVSILGVTAGLQRKDLSPTVVFFDAHGDFHTWETSQSGFIGGMPLAMLVGRGEQTIARGAGLKMVPESSAWLVDGRDLDAGEDVVVVTSHINHVTVDQIASQPPPGDLYVHVDVDVVDPSEMPAVNYPAPGGPSLTQVADAVRTLAETGRVVAFSISSWNPALEGAETAADATDRIAAPFL